MSSTFHSVRTSAACAAMLLYLQKTSSFDLNDCCCCCCLFDGTAVRCCRARMRSWLYLVSAGSSPAPQASALYALAPSSESHRTLPLVAALFPSDKSLAMHDNSVTLHHGQFSCCYLTSCHQLLIDKHHAMALCTKPLILWVWYHVHYRYSIILVDVMA